MIGGVRRGVGDHRSARLEHAPRTHRPPSPLPVADREHVAVAQAPDAAQVVPLVVTEYGRIEVGDEQVGAAAAGVRRAPRVTTTRT